MHTNSVLDLTTTEMCKTLRYNSLIEGTNEAAQDKEFNLKAFQKNLKIVLVAVNRQKLAVNAQENRKAANLPYSSISYADIQQHPIGVFNHKYFEYLACGAWLKDGKSIAIDGNSSKARQELVSAFGNELMGNGIQVLYKDMKEMLRNILVADAKSSLRSALKPLEKTDVLMLDNFELNVLTLKEAYILASIIQSRSKKGGFIFISNSLLEDKIASYSDMGLIDQMLSKHILPSCHQLNFSES
jgi:DNA replication protein DnaC